MVETKDKELEEFINKKDDGLYYLSHASILVCLNRKLYLFDPVLATPPHLGSWVFFPQMHHHELLYMVEYVFASHQHQDHFDPLFLKRLSQSTKLYVISGRPSFEKQMKLHDIQFEVIPENEIFFIDEETWCLGITHEQNQIDSAVVLSNGNFTVYHGNDCYVSTEKLKIISEVAPLIDVACIPFAYIHWYPFLVDNICDQVKENESVRLVKHYLDRALEQIVALDPLIMIPFGANMVYVDNIDSMQNRSIVSVFDFADYTKQTRPQLANKVKTLFAGDIVLKSEEIVEKGKTKCKLEIKSQNLTKSDYLNQLAEFLSKILRDGVGFDTTIIDQVKLSNQSDLGFLKSRINGYQQSVNKKIYLTNSDRKDLLPIAIDLLAKTVDRVHDVDTTKNIHWFKLTDFAYKAYFSGNYTLNEIISSSRFRLFRYPEIHDREVLHVANNIL